jgi:septum formation protein
VAADTVVYINDQVLGKPKDKDDAFRMLSMLAGSVHTVYTGVAICKFENGSACNHISFTESADVCFHPQTDEFLWKYIESGEPMDKAGAYGIQELGSVLVKCVYGDFYTVVGLPISKVVCALAEMGYDIW